MPNYGRSRNLEFPIVDSCLAHNKFHSQINSYLDSCYVMSLVTKTNHNAIQIIDIYV